MIKLEVKLGFVDPLDFRLELEHLDLRLGLGEQELVVTVATLVRRQRQGCWDVYCTAAMGQVRPRRTNGHEDNTSTWEVRMPQLRRGSDGIVQ